MTITKWLPLVLLILIGLIPSMPFIYDMEILGFTGSTFFALMGFIFVCITLGIHQWLFEKGK